jgi:hypothetical protein
MTWKSMRYLSDLMPVRPSTRSIGGEGTMAAGEHIPHQSIADRPTPRTPAPRFAFSAPADVLAMYGRGTLQRQVVERVTDRTMAAPLGIWQHPAA